jgi:tight adherence protein B
MGALLGMLFGAGFVLLSSSWKVTPLPRPRRRKHKNPSVNWPAFVDDVASGIRAGLAAPEALWRAGERLPIGPAMWFNQAEGVWLRAGFTPALMQLSLQCSDAELKQLIDVLLVVQETGSTSLASTLTQLARMSRQRRELINEVKGRQAVTVNAARVAVAAPWIVLVLTSTRPQTRTAFFSSTGLGVLVAIAGVTAVSYFAMRRLATIKQLGLIV